MLYLKEHTELTLTLCNQHSRMSCKGHVSTHGQKAGTSKIQLLKCEIRKRRQADGLLLVTYDTCSQLTKTKTCHAEISSENSTCVSLNFSLVDRCSIGTRVKAFILDAGPYVNKF